MRIGINALYLLPGKVGGSEVHLRNLVKWLGRNRAHEFYIFINRESAGIFEEIAPSFNVVPCGINAESRPLRILYEQVVLPYKVKKMGIDALVSAGMTAPFFVPAVSFLIIHDLQHINMPQNFGRMYLLFLRFFIYMSSIRSDAILTISNKVKRDIVKNYGIPGEDISVIYHGVDKGAFRAMGAQEIDAIRKKYGLPASFALYIASSLPHKNYERLLEAFKIVKASHKELKLVLIGARDYGHDIIKNKIEELGLAGEVVFLGWLPFEDIPVIYSAAGLFVFPSLHEGFGIPVLEAMACGVPVVCSDIEPLDEVAGGAARFVDPLSAESIAKGMTDVLSDRGLRDRLVKDGFERAAMFSWEKTAADTLKAIAARTVKGARH